MKGRVLACLVAGVVLAACGGGGSSNGKATPGGSPATEPPRAGEGALLIANLNTVVEVDVKSGGRKVLLEMAGTNSFVLDPAVSPDGGSIAYIQQPPPKVEEGRFDAGSDLWVMNRDGSGQRLVFAHAQPNQLVRFPRWEDAGHVLAIVQEISTEAGITRVVYTLERIEVATGQRENVMEDVLAFDISPDRQRLVIAKLLPQTGEVLQASGLGGGEAVEVVGVDQLLAPFSYPRFSPDGQTIAFASADQTGARAPVQLVSLERDSSGGFTAPPRPATVLDGLPQDIWRVEAAGGRAVRVANLKEDLPALTWDGSGEHIFAIGVAGMYDVNLETGAADRIGEGAFHAQIAWAP
ncbi:MAG: PD40 domain-containing protein [Chloroflexi bacterium]|nr:PD40 domain-containing protein [Chloroflexota bacterium]